MTFLKSAAAIVALALTPVLTPQAGAAQEVTLRVGHVETPVSTTQVLLETVARKVADATGGAVRMDIFPQSQLGGQREMTEAVQFGALDATAGPAAFMSGFDPLAAFTDIPFLFPADPAKAQQVRDVIAKPFCDSFNSRGFTCIGMYPNGTKQFSSNKPIAALADFSGQKFRVMESAVLVDSLKPIGVTGVPIPFGELYTSLQTGVVDGEENPLDTIANMKFFEVQKHLTLTGHGTIENVILFNPAVWSGMKPEYRHAITKALAETIPDMAAHKRAAADAALEKIRAGGVDVVEASPELLAALREQMVPAARDAFLKVAGAEGQALWDAWQAARTSVGD